MKNHSRSLVPSLLITGLVACSAGGGAGTSNPGGNGAGNANGAAAGGGVDPSAGGTNGILFGGGAGNAGQGQLMMANVGSCGAEVHAAEGLPLDMFIMMDQSGSMNDSVNGGSKWAVVTGALSTFVQSQQTVGLSAGIQYFGLAGSGCNIPFLCTFLSSCVVTDYSTPDVEIGPLPGNGANIAASLGKHQPISDTPTLPALQGAIQHATQWGAAHSGHPTIVVLATDGDPNGCNSTAQNVAQAAGAGFAQSPPMLTFVIGVGSSLTSLNGIAQAGGTNAAFIVDTTQDVNAQFLSALNKIRGAAVLPCAYEIPKPLDATMSVDLNSVNVAYTPGVGPSAGTSTTLYQVTDKTACAAAKGGWYYDNSAGGNSIRLCDETCGPVTADTKGNVSVLVGCATQKAVQ